MDKKNLNINQLLDLAQKALQQKNFDDAKNFFKKIISINKFIPEVHNNLGLVYLNLNNFKEAIECFKEAIKLKPEFSVAFCNLGIVYEKNNNFKLSEENYKKSIYFDNKNIVTYYNLGNLYKDQNDLLNDHRLIKMEIHVRPNLQWLLIFFSF